MAFKQQHQVALCKEKIPLQGLYLFEAKYQNIGDPKASQAFIGIAERSIKLNPYNLNKGVWGYRSDGVVMKDFDQDE